MKTFKSRLTAGAVLLGWLGLVGLAFGQPGSWTRAMDMPMAVGACPAVCEVDGILYVMGGAERTYFDALKTVFAYDPRTDSWTAKKDMPVPRRFTAAAAVDGAIYVIGGSGGPFSAMTVVSEVHAYHPLTDTWTTNAPLPTSRQGLAVCALNGTVYAIGGGTNRLSALPIVEAFDPKANQWTTKANLPIPVVFPTASAANGALYAFIGTSTFRYNPSTDHWTTNASYSPWSYGHMSAAVNGIIYLFGGMTANLVGAYDFALAYDPVEDRFTARRKMPRTCLTAGCAAINGKIYLAGGADKEPIKNPSAIYYKILDVFDPEGGVMPHIVSGTLEGSNAFHLVWRGEAGFQYGVESRTSLTAGVWTRTTLPTGSTVTATNGVVETTCDAAGQPNRFFRVFEAN